MQNPEEKRHEYFELKKKYKVTSEVEKSIRNLSLIAENRLQCIEVKNKELYYIFLDIVQTLLMNDLEVAAMGVALDKTGWTDYLDLQYAPFRGCALFAKSLLAEEQSQHEVFALWFSFTYGCPVVFEYNQFLANRSQSLNLYPFEINEKHKQLTQRVWASEPYDITDKISQFLNEENVNLQEPDKPPKQREPLGKLALQPSLQTILYYNSIQVPLIIVDSKASKEEFVRPLQEPNEKTNLEQKYPIDQQTENEKRQLLLTIDNLLSALIPPYLLNLIKIQDNFYQNEQATVMNKNNLSMSSLTASTFTISNAQSISNIPKPALPMCQALLVPSSVLEHIHKLYQNVDSLTMERGPGKITLLSYNWEMKLFAHGN